MVEYKLPGRIAGHGDSNCVITRTCCESELPIEFGLGFDDQTHGAAQVGFYEVIEGAGRVGKLIQASPEQPSCQAFEHVASCYQLGSANDDGEDEAHAPWSNRWVVVAV